MTSNKQQSSSKAAPLSERTADAAAGSGTAADVMTSGIKTASPNTPLAAVASLMRDESVGIVPIVDDERGCLLGVITDRDIVVRVDAEAAPVDLVRAGDVMTTSLTTVRPSDDLHDVIDRMGQEGLHRMLVTDDGNRLLGIISVSDLARRTDLPERIHDMLDQISRRQP
jgi:CBS domain-containing protein